MGMASSFATDFCRFCIVQDRRSQNNCSELCDQFVSNGDNCYSPYGYFWLLRKMYERRKSLKKLRRTGDLQTRNKCFKDFSLTRCSRALIIICDVFI